MKIFSMGVKMCHLRQKNFNIFKASIAYTNVKINVPTRRVCWNDIAASLLIIFCLYNPHTHISVPISLSSAILCQMVPFQYSSRSSLRRLASLPLDRFPS